MSDEAIKPPQEEGASAKAKIDLGLVAIEGLLQIAHYIGNDCLDRTINAMKQEVARQEAA